MSRPLRMGAEGEGSGGAAVPLRAQPARCPIGSTVEAFTRSMAKRELTFFSGIAAIRRL